MTPLLASGGLTTLRLARQRERLRLTLSREFDDDVDFAAYAREFSLDQTPCADPRTLGDAESRALLAAAGAGPALARLQDLMRAGRHEMVVLHVHATLGMRCAHYIHSSALGRNNGLHAVRAGGLRRHGPEEPEADVWVDGLNLARGMSFKNAAADLPLGGCKMTVQAAPLALDDAARLGFLAWCIDGGSFLTGPDMGFSPETADALRARFTRHIVGGARGVLGPTGAPTARGCATALREMARARWGSSDLVGRTVAVQGLGAVGLSLAKLLREAGMRLVAADPDAGRVERARAECGEIEVVAPERVLAVECDVLAPCAVGGVLDEESIARLRCAIVCGSANNQLRAVSQEGELALAERVAARGVLYAPEWTHNIAGVVAGFEEYVRGEEARMERVDAHVARVCGEEMRALLAEARESVRTPTAVAYARVERRIYPG